MIEIKIEGEKCQVKTKSHNLREILIDIRSLDTVRCNLLDTFKKDMIKQIHEQYPYIPLEQIKNQVEDLANKELENILVVFRKENIND